MSEATNGQAVKDAPAPTMPLDVNTTTGEIREEPQTPAFQAPLGGQTAPGSPLAAKLAIVMGEVARIPKNGRNTFHGYNYAMESDIVESVRGGLARLGVAFMPSIETFDMRPIGTEAKPKFLTILRLTMTLIDGASGERFSVTWFGTAEDSADKGLYKAMTGAEKYFLLKTFLIPTGDDPERDRDRDDDDRGHGKGQRTQGPARREDRRGNAVPATSTPVRQAPETKAPAQAQQPAQAPAPATTPTQAPTQASAPATAPQEGPDGRADHPTTIGKVGQRGDGLYIMELADGRRVFTTDTNLVREAVKLRDEKAQVLVETERVAQGLRVLELRRVQ